MSDFTEMSIWRTTQKNLKSLLNRDKYNHSAHFMDFRDVDVDFEAVDFLGYSNVVLKNCRLSNVTFRNSKKHSVYLDNCQVASFRLENWSADKLCISESLVHTLDVCNSSFRDIDIVKSALKHLTLANVDSKLSLRPYDPGSLSQLVAPESFRVLPELSIDGSVVADPATAKILSDPEQVAHPFFLNKVTLVFGVGDSKKQAKVMWEFLENHIPETLKTRGGVRGMVIYDKKSLNVGGNWSLHARQEKGINIVEVLQFSPDKNSPYLEQFLQNIVQNIGLADFGVPPLKNIHIRPYKGCLLMAGETEQGMEVLYLGVTGMGWEDVTDKIRKVMLPEYALCTQSNTSLSARIGVDLSRRQYDNPKNQKEYAMGRLYLGGVQAEQDGGR